MSMVAEVGDVIQINEYAHTKPWIGCFMVVDKVYGDTVRAGLKLPGACWAYLFVTPDEYDIIGRAALIPIDEDEGEGAYYEH